MHARAWVCVCVHTHIHASPPNTHTVFMEMFPPNLQQNLCKLRDSPAACAKGHLHNQEGHCPGASQRIGHQSQSDFYLPGKTSDWKFSP